MKYGLLFIMTILTFPSFGQDIEKVIFTSQQVDEPPTKHGRSKFIIEFLRQESGELIASVVYENKKRKKLRDKATIDNERVNKISEWERHNKRIFTQSDLLLDISALKQRNSYKLNFDIPIELTVNVDSFRFCKSYDNLKTNLLGGEIFTVTFVYKSGQKNEFIIDNNVKGDDFNLRGYILCNKLLADKIPSEVPTYDFFSPNKFLDIVLYYQKTVECEGFYYKEFTDKHPTMTSKDRRMMTGWNFVEYMKQRNKKE